MDSVRFRGFDVLNQAADGFNRGLNIEMHEEQVAILRVGKLLFDGIERSRPRAILGV